MFILGLRGDTTFSITLRSRRHSIDTEASATLKGRRGFRVDAVTLREDLLILGGFLMHPTTTNMNIGLYILGGAQKTLYPPLLWS